MLAQTSHYDQRDVKQQEGGVGMGVCLMNELASRSDLDSQIGGETKSCTIYDDCAETDQDNIDRHIRSLAKVSDSSARLCTSWETVSGIKPGIGRKLARRTQSSHRRLSGLAYGLTVHGIRPGTILKSVCACVSFI